MNYPGQPKRSYKKPKTATQRQMANKGKVTESIIDRVNKQYEITGAADIKKIPTPVQITNVNNQTGVVTGKKSKGYLTDYLGVMRGGRAVCFDAKECANATSFPLKNLHAHQYELMRLWHTMGAASFLIVHKKMLKKWYRVPFTVIEQYWAGWKDKTGPASIPQAVFDRECIEIKPTLKYMLHYLEGLE